MTLRILKDALQCSSHATSSMKPSDVGLALFVLPSHSTLYPLSEHFFSGDFFPGIQDYYFSSSSILVNYVRAGRGPGQELERSGTESRTWSKPLLPRTLGRWVPGGFLHACALTRCAPLLPIPAPLPVPTLVPSQQPGCQGTRSEVSLACVREGSETEALGQSLQDCGG